MLPKIDHTLITNWKNPDYYPILVKRAEIIEYISSSKVRMQYARDFYKENPISFINDFMWTIDPRKKDGPKKMPFVLYEKQEEFINWVDSCYLGDKNGIAKKSRELGVSWLCCAYSTHKFLFFPDFKVMMGSRKEDYVDQIGQLDSILEKIRFLMRHLPRIWLPKGFDFTANMRFKNISNPENGASIKGESGTELGRGGRCSIAFPDEAAFIEHPMQMEAAISETTRCIIYVSTPRAKADWFDTKWEKGVIEKFRFRWQDDPRKDLIWYNKRVAELDPLIVATEIDGDLSVSYDNVVLDYRHIQAAMNLNTAWTIEGEGKRIAGFDLADEGRDKHCLYIRHGNKGVYLEEWAEGDTFQATQKAWMICEMLKVDLINYDCIGVGAGAKASFKNLKDKSKEKGLLYDPEIHPVRIGSDELTGFYSEGKKNKDMFYNLKAKVWWDIRAKIKVSYDFLEWLKIQYPEGLPYKEKVSIPDNLIILPDDPDLRDQLSQQQYTFKDSGQIIMKSKQEVYKRSPNKADAVILSYAHSGYTQRDFIII
jgi:hypothetical protein